MAFNETDGWLGARTTLSLHVGLQWCWRFMTSQMVWVNTVQGSRRDEGMDGWMDRGNDPGPPCLVHGVQAFDIP